MSLSHPSHELLVAFAHGRLADDELLAMETHVAECETCCDALRQVPHDGLIENLRSSTSRLIVQEQAGPPPRAAVSPTPLEHHPRYQVVRELGSGGMGTVYLAEHRVMGRQVALKVINRRLLRHQLAIERFRQEVQAAARLNHRNIVTAFDAEQAGDLHFLVMEYVDGTDLATVVARRGPLPVLHACHAIIQAAQGLQHAHEQGMVHRDIKPQNLMRTRKGVIKILDFGLARLAAPSESGAAPAGLTLEGVTLGTPDYIAPEQARDARRADIRSDLYSLGCTLYFLLTGVVPFPTGTAVEKLLAHCTASPTPVSQLRAGLPEPLVEILERMMARDPADRFQTPEEVAAALKPFGSLSANQPLPDMSLQHNRIVAAPPTRLDEKVPSHSPAPAQSATRQDMDWPVTGVRPEDQRPRRRVRLILGSLVASAALIVGISLTWPSRVPAPTPPPDVPQSFPGKPETTPAEGTWRDLLAETAPARDTVAGIWTRTAGGLTVDASEWARLAVPGTVPAEYDLDVEFTRQSGGHSVAVIFPVGRGQATLELDAWGQHLAGIQSIRGRDLRQQEGAPFALTNGQRYRVTLKVRRDGVTAQIDDRPLATYRGDGSDLSCLPGWELPDSRRVGIAAFESATTFHSLRLRAAQAR